MAARPPPSRAEAVTTESRQTESTSSLGGWQCSRCTFVHKSPVGTRCAMCQELRVTKSHMRDFIQGKPIPDDIKTNPLLIRRTSHDTTTLIGRANNSGTSAGQKKQMTMIPQKQSLAKNPYAKKSQSTNSKIQQSMLMNHTSSCQQTLLTGTNVYSIKKVTEQSQQNLCSSEQMNRSVGAISDVLTDTDEYDVLQQFSDCQEVSCVKEAAFCVTAQFNDVINDNACCVSEVALDKPMEISAKETDLFSGSENIQHLDLDYEQIDIKNSSSSRTLVTRQSTLPFSTTSNKINDHVVDITQNRTKQINSDSIDKVSRGKPRLTALHRFLPYIPGPVPINLELAKTWIYPSDDNYPIREYQIQITKTAIYHNTLVSLPTGLGKTLIAAVVVYNFYRWFDRGKVIFMAPTLPLVHQQVRACYEIMGIPQDDTHVLTGKMSPEARSSSWKTKRVFFCTPQTVQKDLESGRCDASKVVCIVLDEAHKATGDYAYVRVLRLLENSNAKFRILGLSATPGTNIKAIQLVVDTLRINKIECRLDTDPDVAQYIHQRSTEVIIIPQTDALKTIERALSDLITPLLDRLKTTGIFRLSGLATVSEFSIMQGREDYLKRTGDKSLLGYFFAAQQFVKIRTVLHKQGIGIVRTELLKLRQQRLQGLLASIVKGQSFQKLWELVKAASFDPSIAASKDTNDRENLINYPKLSKLQEILTEHFERSKACGTSSRAIVFSHLRDSVFEIVSALDQLKPLVQPRHFIGQSNGKNTKSSKSDGRTECVGDEIEQEENESRDETIEQHLGMNQNEQQQVLHDFKNGIYNVLVCTCIGEEGLDIGEVDLIVNFDTLKSPIRMLQRVGRTGRKRNGRVVCLVAEGAEERTHHQSRQSERNLAHALKNPKSFKVLPTLPLFPSEPAMETRSMRISESFRMSQVNQGASKKRKSFLSAFAKSGSWRLNEEQEWSRERVLGPILKKINFDESLEKNSHLCGLPVTFVRRFLAARKSSRGHRNKRLQVGVANQVMRLIEDSFSSDLNPNTLEQPPLNECHFSRHGSTLTDFLFPIVFDGTKEENNSTLTQSALSPPNKMEGEDEKDGDSEMVAAEYNKDSTRAVSTNEINPQLQESLNCHINEQVFPDHLVSKPVKTLTGNADPVAYKEIRKSAVFINQSNPFYANETKCCFSDGTAATCRRDSLKCSSPKLSEEKYLVVKADNAVIGGEVLSTATNSVEHSSKGSQVFEIAEQRQQVDLLHLDREFISETRTANHRVTDDTCDVFFLPSASESSSDDGSVDVNADTEKFKFNNDAVGMQDNLNLYETKVPSPSSVNDEELFRLPSQQSSSDDDRSESDENDAGAEECKHNMNGCTQNNAVVDSETENTHQALTNNTIFGEIKTDLGLNPEQNFKNPNDATSINIHTQSKSFGSTRKSEKEIPSTAPKLTCNHVNEFGTSLNVDSPITLSSNRLSGESDDISEKLNRRRTNNTKRAFALIDTPASEDRPSESRLEMRSPVLSVVSRFPESETKIGLVNTQPKSDIVCLICQGGDSPDEDPIILCDGVGKDGPCNVAVHVTCYSVSVDLNSDEEWRCDPCEYKAYSANACVRCQACGQSGGAIKRQQNSFWIHILCYNKIARGGVFNPGNESKTAIVPTCPPAFEDSVAHRRGHKKRLQKSYMRFIDDEAVDMDDDLDGDEAEEEVVKAIEEDEALMEGFINDSSQLGHTPDSLDNVDSSGYYGQNWVHRALDNERERINEFVTPVFNRLKLNGHLSSSEGPDSASGLGRMHFIRSVLEHHRNGGNADDIETFYKQTEGDIASAASDDD